MSRIKYLAILFVLGAIMTVPVIALAAQPAATSPLTVTLNPLNNSGESGSAVLTDLGNGQLKVDVTITGEPADGSHLMHIHTGQCGPTLGPVVFPLTNVVGGTSTTTITATLDSLMDGNHAINLHLSKAAPDAAHYVACGNIPSAAAAQTTATTAPAAAATITATTTSETPAATSTVAAPATAPSTGGNPPNLWLPALVLGLVVLVGGLLALRLTK